LIYDEDVDAEVFRVVVVTNKRQLVLSARYLREIETVELLNEQPPTEEADKLVAPQCGVRKILMDKLPEDMTDG